MFTVNMELNKVKCVCVCHLIIVRHVNIKHQLLGSWFEDYHSLVILWTVRKTRDKLVNPSIL